MSKLGKRLIKVADEVLEEMEEKRSGKAHIHDEEGTVIDKDTFAVTWSAQEGWGLLIPKAQPTDEIPFEAAALIGAATLLKNDPAFRQQCLDYMAGRIKEEKAKDKPH